jgi:glycosyltransferase involved in cell wall biosynthesis
MKVGFLTSSVSREAGGLFQSVQGLAKAVMSASASVRVFGISDSKSAVDLLTWQPLSVRTFPPQFRAWSYSAQLVPALLGSDLDILSTHGLWKYGSVASGRWHRWTRGPYVVHPHGMLESWALRNAKWKKRIAALLYEDQHLRGAACLHALCEAEAQTIRAYGLRNAICTIPNGIDLPQLDESSKLRVEVSTLQTVTQGRRMLLYLGRLHPKKNLVSLLRAWASAQKSGVRSPDPGEWLLAIAGWSQGEHEDELKKLTTSHQLLTTVRFLGPQFGRDKDACYRACDAFILPSLSEGLPMTVLEAWAYAKPVLMTPECNLPEGFAVGAALQIGTNPSEIATGLKQLFEMSDDNRATMGARGRTLVAETFSWPRIGEQMNSVYQWVLGGGPVPEIIRLCERRVTRC